jgi:hypothetical protein
LRGNLRVPPEGANLQGPGSPVLQPDEKAPGWLYRTLCDVRRIITSACLKHWHKHPWELDIPLSYIYDVMGMDMLEAEQLWWAENKNKLGSVESLRRL